MRKILFAICMSTAFTACNKEDAPQKPEGLVDRTVLIYMAGENNLTNWDNTPKGQYISRDLDEIKIGARSIGNNNLLVYVDKADSIPPYLLYFWQNELRDSIPMEESKTSDPAVLEKIARKAFTDYPANSYGLVLWGHANGWIIKNDSVEYTSMARRKAYGGDNGNNSTSGSGKTWMNLPSMARALSHLPHLDFIFADCCQMMCVECAYELKDVTDYYIASPAEIPAQGAPYNTIVPAMMEKTTYWTSMVDKYFAQTTEDLGNRVPLAVIKTSEMDNLANATRTILQSIPAEKGIAPFPNLNGIIYYYSYNYFDMNDFLLKYAPEAEYNSWKKVFDDAVVYSKMATKWDTSKVWFDDFDMNEKTFGGVTMFIPRYNLQWSDNLTIRQMKWYYAAGYSDIGW